MSDDLVERHIEQLRLTGGDLADLCQPIADAIEALIVKRDAAYASGYSDAETEISNSALGQSNTFLHSQLANAKHRAEAAEADAARLLRHIKAADEYLDKGLEEHARNVTRAALKDDAKARIEALTAERDRLRKALEDIIDDCEADYPPSHGAIKYAAKLALKGGSHDDD